LAQNKLESEGVKKQIAKAIAGGQSQGEIAKDLGVSQPTISHLVNKGDVKALIEAETLKLLDAVPQAVENLKALVNEMPDIPKKETKRRELAYKASTEVLKTAGLLPTPIQSQTLINIYAENLFASPLIETFLALLKEQMNMPEPGEVDYEGSDD
jgi:predicted XRE-type DNA-binding protein